jgi:hypothetical protein
MPTVEEFTDPYAAAYTPPPYIGSGVCDVCHGAPLTGDARCWSCRQTTQSASRPVELVVPISLYELGGQLHTVLKDYKRSTDSTVRDRHRLQVAATLHRFLRDHGDHIRAAAGGDWDTITIIPSKQSGREPHALEQVIMMGRSIRALYRPLLEPWEPDTIGRAVASDRGFRATTSVRGLRVLMLDDTFTSGATFQSAASALALAGATVVAGVVIGRVIHPEFSEETRELWDAQDAIPFDFTVCCLEPA